MSRSGRIEINILPAEDRTDFENALQAGHARAAENPEQHGFRLVVGGVRGRHEVCSMPVGDVLEELVPQMACGGLDAVALLVGKRGHIGMAQLKRQIQPPRQVGHKSCVVLGLCPQTVVEMGDDEPPRSILFERREATAQGPRCRPRRKQRLRRHGRPIRRPSSDR